MGVGVQLIWLWSGVWVAAGTVSWLKANLVFKKKPTFSWVLQDVQMGKGPWG